METFNFPLHTLSVKYPDSSVKVQFGKGYEFASAPRGPDQVEYTLEFDAMFFFESSPGVLDKVTRPTVNMAVLEDFYQLVKLYTKFIYPHPTLGNLTVRFGEPLAYKVAKNGKGRVEPFSIKLVLQP